MKISASFLSCEKIIPAIKKLNMTDVDYIHVDFIDNNFVKGKKIPFHKLKKISKISSKRLDIHLMTNKLEKYIKKFSMLNCEYITFHIEVLENVEKYINMIHSYGIKCGLAINPDTDFDKIKPYIEMIDLILVMSVTPGYGGQQFIPTTEDKLKKIRKYITDNKIKVIVNVDGGINNTTINKVNKYVDMVVSGSYITNSNDFQENINNLRRK
mgnify:FL=1